MTEFSRHDYPVLEVCEALKGSVSGSFGGLQQDQLQDRAEWLKWRIFDGWEPGTGAFYSYDRAVRSLAMYALEVWQRHAVACDEPTVEMSREMLAEALQGG